MQVNFTKLHFSPTDWSGYPDADEFENDAFQCRKFLKMHPADEGQNFMGCLKFHLDNKTDGLPDCCESFLNAASEVFRLYQATCVKNKAFEESLLNLQLVVGYYSILHMKTDPLEIAKAFGSDPLSVLTAAEAKLANLMPSTDIVRAFKSPFIDDSNLLARLMSEIREMASGWERDKYYSPYSSILQSSGCGKTRSVVEFGKRCWLFFVCFRQPGSTGYPQRSFAADCLTKFGSQFVEMNLSSGKKSKLLKNLQPLELLKAFYASVWIACVDCLREDLQNTKLASLEEHYQDWIEQQLAVDAESSEIGKPLWTKILTLAIEIMRKMSASNFKAAELELQELMKSSYGLLEDLLAGHMFTSGNSERPLLLFALDEASELTNCENKNLLEPFRQALSYIPDAAKQSNTLSFSVLMDTYTKLANFHPGKNLSDRSKRSMGEKLLFRPIWILSNWNLQIEKHEPSLVLPLTEFQADRLDRSLRDFAKLCGRPLWLGYTNYSTMINIALGKILGGLDLSEMSKVKCTTEMALALLGCRFALNFHAFSRFVPALCTSHMATCLFIFTNPDHIVAGYPSEPVLAEAAALASRRFKEFRVEVLLNHLIDQVKEGVVEAGYRGELVAKIILLLARDLAVVNDGEDSDNSIIKPCTVQHFMNTLCGENIVEEHLVKKWMAGSESFLHGFVYFTHFVYVVYMPTLEDMKKFFMRGAAIFCRRLQKGIDCIIPVMLPAGEWSYILVSVKNYCYHSNLSTIAPFASSAKKAGIDENKNCPYLLLFMDVGSQLKCNVSTPVDYSRVELKRKVQQNASAALPMTLAITGLSKDVYPFFSAYDSLEESLIKLSNAWVEPLDLVDSVYNLSQAKAKKNDLKRIMFLTYETDDPATSGSSVLSSSSTNRREYSPEAGYKKIKVRN